jgi:hypothetical protein
MVLINEWLPNPNGPDTKTEFIELFNNGRAPVSLDGWSLKTTGKKSFSLGGKTIPAGGYLVLWKTETKLSLKNSDEMVFLYNAAGRLVDESSYIGPAPSGESFARVHYPSNTLNPLAVPQSFTWAKTPTPGGGNQVKLYNSIAVREYPYGVALNHPAPSAAEFAALIVGTAAILAVLVVYFLKSDENISKLFFAGDG